MFELPHRLARAYTCRANFCSEAALGAPTFASSIWLHKETHLQTIQADMPFWAYYMSVTLNFQTSRHRSCVRDLRGQITSVLAGLATSKRKGILRHGSLGGDSRCRNLHTFQDRDV